MWFTIGTGNTPKVCEWHLFLTSFFLRYIFNSSCAWLWCKWNYFVNHFIHSSRSNGAFHKMEGMIFQKNIVNYRLKKQRHSFICSKQFHDNFCCFIFPSYSQGNQLCGSIPNRATIIMCFFSNNYSLCYRCVWTSWRNMISLRWIYPLLINQLVDHENNLCQT